MTRRADTALANTASLQTLSVRIGIERSLTKESNPSIALFALPASQGGYLETVRDIVTSTLVNEVAAGQNINGNADEDLARATTHLPPVTTSSPTSSTPRPTATRWARA